MKPSILVVHNFDIFWFMTHLSKLFKITETAWNNFEQVVLKWGKAWWAARIASAVLQERHGEGSGAREGPFEDTGDTWRYHTTSIHIHPHPDHPDHRTWCHMIEHGGKHGGGYNMIYIYIIYIWYNDTTTWFWPDTLMWWLWWFLKFGETSAWTMMKCIRHHRVIETYSTWTCMLHELSWVHDILILWYLFVNTLIAYVYDSAHR